MSTQNGDGTGEGQDLHRDGNLAFGPEQPKPNVGPSIADAVGDVRKRIADGENPLDGMVAEGEEAVDHTVPEDDVFHGVEHPSAQPGAEGEGDGDGEGEGEGDGEGEDQLVELPDGFVLAEDGSIRRADGTFPSAKELEEIQEQIDAQGEGEAEGEGEGEGEGEDEGDGEDGGETGDEGEDEGEPTTVRLPGRGPDDEDEEWEVDDPKLAESINRLRNGFMRGEEAHRQLDDAAAQRNELDFVLDSLQADPEGFVLEHVTNPEIRHGLAMQLMTDPDVFNQVMETFGALEGDDDALSAKRNELELQRLKNRQKVQDELQSRRSQREQLKAITNTIDGFADAVPQDKRDTFTRIASRELADYLRSNDMNSVEVGEIPLILQKTGVLPLFGLSPDAASGANGSRANGAGPADGAQPPKGGTAQADDAAAGARKVNARKVGEQLRAAREKREMAAAVTPPGSGAGPTRLTPPEGQGVRDRIKWYRKRVKR